MRIALWAAELAKRFWSYVGEEESFPRHLRDPIRAMPLTLEPIPELSVAQACRWLETNGIAHGFSGADRRLRGCLTAHYGHGVIFLDAADPEDEQRFTLAHELAHFLRDYWRPRQLALERLGAQALEVLDGKRPPTPGERVGALFAEVPLSFHMHLMDRDERRRPVNFVSNDIEACADRLAYEILAPAEHIRADHAVNASKKLLEERLLRYYKLPRVQAQRYSRQLLGEMPAVEPWLISVRKALQG